ncbi:Salicylic acid-binding protein 2 [Sarracenia purpurea var. burkii]
MEAPKQKKHFVLVHGACHGAWCWYKLKSLLESSGGGDITVTLLDLAASGINTKSIQEVRTLHEYSAPLIDFMTSISPNEKVILVGHSLGGMNLALAMDEFPEKISVAVFLTAFMPDSAHEAIHVLEQFTKRTSLESWLDTRFESSGTPEESFTFMLFGPNFLASKLYQLCSIEDLTLAKTLMRPSSLFLEDLAKAKKFSDEGYGSVVRVYIVCSQDKAITEEFQRWIIETCGVEEVKEIKGADHMPMFSKPQELCNCLMEVANKYA